MKEVIHLTSSRGKEEVEEEAGASAFYVPTTLAPPTPEPSAGKRLYELYF